MSMPTPNLDDRRFQDIVDEAKRLIPRYCPQWTDHNVSDPGIALLELFAWMTEMTLYRLNQVPDVLYVKFLELMGIRLFPGASARTHVTFWLAAPQPQPIRIAAGTQVGTVRTGSEQAVVFLTDEELEIRQPELSACLAGSATGRFEDAWNDLRNPRQGVRCFLDVQAGDAIYFGFSDSLARHALRLDVQARIEGIGVDPTRPPWAWEVWTGDAWRGVRVHDDTTAGLNTDGSIVLLVGDRQQPLTLGPTRAHWLRCRMVKPVAGQPPYEHSPQVVQLEAVALGGTVAAHHGEAVGEELLGRSDGSPGQSFSLRRRPVLPRRRGEHVVVGTGDEATVWTETSDGFASSTSEDRHVAWSDADGEISFGPRIRHPDGHVRQHGAVPPPDAPVRVTRYRWGGGAHGNVGAGTLSVLKSSIPYIASVVNLDPARGGVDPESIDNAKRRGPLSLLTGQRAVTVRDYERLALEATPDVGRARCLPPADPEGPVRVLLVPRLHVAPQELTLDKLALPKPLQRRVGSYLDDRRTLNTTIEISTPSYRDVTVVATVRGATDNPRELIRDLALSALYRYINPLVGGPAGIGWPYGRDLNLGEIFALLTAVDGVVGVEEVLLFMANPRTGQVGNPLQRVPLPDDALFASWRHQVRVNE